MANTSAYIVSMYIQCSFSVCIEISITFTLVVHMMNEPLEVLALGVCVWGGGEVHDT